MFSAWKWPDVLSAEDSVPALATALCHGPGSGELGLSSTLASLCVAKHPGMHGMKVAHRCVAMSLLLK